MEKRKLIAHGPSSLTIALPFRWIKKYKLQKGDVVSVDEDDQGLRINPTISERKKAISINLAKHDWPAIVTVLTTVYRRGYDEVTVRYETPEEYQSISNAAHTLLGYAIVENRKGKCIIKSLPSELEQNFQTLFRRIFFILIQQLEDLQDALSFQEKIKKFYHRDSDLNAIVNLAIRMINKGYVLDHFEELHLFHALLVLEESGDDIMRFTIEIQNYKEAQKLKEAVQKAALMFNLLHDGYFKKTVNIMEFYKEYYLYWPDAEKMPAPTYEYLANASKAKPVFYIRSFVEKVIQLAEILLLPQAQVELNQSQ